MDMANHDVANNSNGQPASIELADALKTFPDYTIEHYAGEDRPDQLVDEGAYIGYYKFEFREKNAFLSIYFKKVAEDQNEYNIIYFGTPTFMSYGAGRYYNEKPSSFDEDEKELIKYLVTLEVFKNSKMISPLHRLGSKPNKLVLKEKK